MWEYYDLSRSEKFQGGILRGMTDGNFDEDGRVWIAGQHEGFTFQPKQPDKGMSRRQLLLQSRIDDSKAFLIQLTAFS